MRTALRTSGSPSCSALRSASIASPLRQFAEGQRGFLAQVADAVAEQRPSSPSSAGRWRKLAQRPGGAQANLPEVVFECLHQRFAGFGQGEFAEGAGGFLAHLPGRIGQGGLQGRQHAGVDGQAKGAGGGAADLGVRVVAGQPGQVRPGPSGGV